MSTLLQKKIGHLICFLTILIILPVILTGCGVGFKNEPDNFRGIKWGTNIKDLSDFTLIVNSDNEKTYFRNNDKKQIGDANIDVIAYNFYKDRFYSAGITYKSDSNHQKIKQTLFSIYGRGYQENEYISHYVWRGENVELIFSYKDILEDGAILYLYNPIVYEKSRDERNTAKKGTGDL